MANAGRPRTKYASNASRALDPSGTSRCLLPLPVTVNTPPDSGSSAADASSTLRPSTSDTRAPVAYRASRRALSRRPEGVSVGHASSSAATSSMLSVSGSRSPVDGGETSAATSDGSTPSSTPNLCRPRATVSARPADEGASGRAPSTPRRRSATYASMSVAVTSVSAVLPAAASQSVYLRTSRV